MLEVFQIPFMQQALLASLLVGATCAFLSGFVVLKRIVFVGITLAQLSSAGVALAMLFGLTAGFYPTIASLLFMLIGVALFSLRPSGRRLTQESLIGLAYATATALGVLLVARSASGESHLLNLLFGNILAAIPRDSCLMAGVFAAVGVVHYLFHKEFVFVSFDAEMARTLGVKPRLWDLLLYLTLGVTIAVSIRVAGVLLVFAFLVIPGMIGLLLTQRLKYVFLIAIGAAIIPVVLGLYLSFIFDLPSAATIVLAAFLLLCLAYLIGKMRAS
jgi:ABC-type Mn2+/Zn2+ transport system permease subunit